LTPKLTALTSGFPEIDAPARACRCGRRPSRLVARPNDAPAQLVHDRRLAARMPDVGRRELDARRGAWSSCAGDGFGHYRCSFRLCVRRCGTRTTRMCPWASPSCPTVTHAGPSLTTATLQVTGPACTRRAIRGELLGQLQSTGRAVATVETCVAVATRMGRQHYNQGQLAQNIKRTRWQRGAVVEAAYTLYSNHAGGYSCKSHFASLSPRLRMLLC
jgi:hypothetical protein